MANVDAMVQQAVAAIKANRRAEARQILEQALAIDEYHEQAWLWLSGCVDTLEEQLTCLENVLTVNPENPKAQKGIAAVRARLSASPPARPGAPAPPPPDPFANSPFSEPPPNPYGDAYEPDPWTSAPPDSSRSVSSVEWGPAPTAPQTGRRSALPSDEEYDQWVANLPIGVTNGSRGASPNSVFTEDIFNVASGPFTTPDEETAEPFSFDAASPFDSYNPVETFKPDSTPGNAGAPSFGSFSASLEPSAPPAMPPQAPRAASPATDYDDLRFTDEDEAAAEPDGVETVDAGAFALHAGGWDAANPFMGGRDVVLGSSAGAMPSAGLFKAIPADIQLGASGEKAGPVLIITTALLAVLNLAALIVLLNNLPR
ncbi:MAG: hypothetical protein IT323_17835 [Anaerolineae bacterium]|nr:hypothetical protein [Anaerolineae bacterium]